MRTRKQLRAEIEYYRKLYYNEQNQSMRWWEQYVDIVFENGKLIKENKQLKKQIAKLTKR